MLGPANDWFFGVSINGWTSNDLALKWLQLIFDPATQQPRETDWRLVLMDGHASHVSVEFLDGRWRRIIPMCFPPHSTHIMQPLDVSIFGPLTQAYRDQVMELGEEANKIDRAQFASIYATARAKAITQMAARKAFVECGMTSRPNEEKILMRLPEYIPPSTRTPSPLRLDQADTRHDAKRFYSMLLDFEKSDSPRERAWLRRKLKKTYETRDADAILLTQQEQQRHQASQKAKRTVLLGDRKMISKDKMIRRDWAEQRISEMAPQIGMERQAREQRAQQKDMTRQDPGPSTLVSNHQSCALMGGHDAQTTPSRPQVVHYPDAAEPPISHSGWTCRFFDPSAPLGTPDDLSPPPPRSVPSPPPQFFVPPPFYWPSM